MCDDKSYRVRARHRVLVALAAALTLPLTALGMDLDKQVTFNIPAQNLDAALLQFSQQARIQVIVNGDIRGAATQGITGQLAIRQALSALLQPAGLRYRVASDDTITVGKANPANQGNRAGHEGSERGSSIGSEASASPNPPGGNGAAESEVLGGIPEIVVTARKREERLVEVPATINVFSSRQLAQSGNYSLSDLQSNLPNFFITSPRNYRTAVTMRGFGVPGVGLYIDGVYQANPAAFTIPLFDVDRVEILKGPQGTLYGRNAYSGAVNYVTRAPTSQFEGEINAEAGNGDTFRGSLTMAGPIVGDVITARLSAAVQRRDGFRSFSNGADADRDDYDAISARVLISPTENLKLDLKYSFIDRTSPSFLYYQVNDINDKHGRLLVTPRLGPASGALAGRRPEGKLRDNAFTARLSYAFEAFDAVSITSYDRIHSNALIDADISAPDILEVLSTFARRDFSEEVRLQSTGDGPFKWLAGAYYTKGNDNDCATCGNVLGGLALGGTSIFQQYSPTFFEGYAAFTDLEYKLSDHFVIGAGARYDSIEQELRLLNGTRARQTFHGFQPKATVRYLRDSDAQIYASISKGFTEGGFNSALIGTGSPLETFPNQQLWSYEIGVKSAFLDRRADIAVALFYIDAPSFHAPATVPTPLGPRVVTAPVGKIKSYGIETDATFRLMEGLTLELSGGYNIAEPTRLSPSIAPGVGNVGEQVQRAPKWSYRVGGTYSHPVSPDLSVELNAAASGVGPTRFGGEAAVNGPLDRRAAYHLVDVSAGLVWSNFRVAVFAKNLLDETYTSDFLSASGFAQFGGPSAGVVYGDPRYVGVRANLKF